ncbi:uncharacterized protein LOC128079437 isoform X2 [Tympanuchus pallidicinctus]|uniref:uncharacterized protein LOC128079437 isoform X2 n=1 Tax=Tympanuchus pallidicinctus TaxID=109042 RepID=UPI0022871835|nr:uncharacterized protein LOC128079437 isoform X2 [Tympanuchus pallidicinctus]
MSVFGKRTLGVTGCPPFLLSWMCRLSFIRLVAGGSERSTAICDKEKDQEQDVAEFSFAVANLEDMGTYRCRYQVSEPLWTSELSDPVELMLAGAEVSSRGNLAAWGCAAALIFGLSLCFILDAWTWRDESPGLTPETPKSVPFQVPPRDSEDLTYVEMPAATPCPQPPSSPPAPQPPVIYTAVSSELPC